MSSDLPSKSATRGLILFVAIAFVVIAAAFLPRATSSQVAGATLTHTVTRGDLVVTVVEQGTLESSNNTEIKCKVRGYNTVIWVIEGGAEVQAGDELVRLDTKRHRGRHQYWQTTNFHTATADARTIQGGGGESGDRHPGVPGRQLCIKQRI